MRTTGTRSGSLTFSSVTGQRLAALFFVTIMSVSILLPTVSVLAAEQKAKPGALSPLPGH
jgi:hypothetical protein